jgi:alginate O-acetyltransferase complex protein AlgI
MAIILFSLFFYGWWDWRFIGLILLSGAIDYFAALGISKHSASKRRWLVLSIVGNLGVLGFFKYYGFFAESLNLMLSRLGLEAAAPLISPVLPIGLSFYTFQSMSYTIDVYRRRLEPTRSFTLFFAYLTMFPQLVAGPICRAGDLMGQIEDLPATRREDFEAGLWLIVIGYFKDVLPMARGYHRPVGNLMPRLPVVLVIARWAHLSALGHERVPDGSNICSLYARSSSRQ